MAKKKQADLFGDEGAAAGRAVNEFEALLNASSISARGLTTGDRFRGEILAVSGQEAFVSTGTPTDATLPFALGGDTEKPKVGDFVEVIVVRVREGEILVRPVGARGGSTDVDNLEDAYDMELPVEGTVVEAVKGGFRVKVHGQSAFCPISQIDWRCVTPAEYVGRKFEFIITKFEKGRDLVVSRRRILEQERAASEGEFLQSGEVGTIYSGEIFRLEKYGAFVRLENGIEGLIPISEMSWGRIAHPQDVAHTGQMVQVKLLRVMEEEGRLKVSFSLKQGGAVADPWATISEDFPIGSQHEGTVEHREAFGLFVNIGLGVTGLLPRSSWRDAVDGAQYETKRKGDKVRVRVERLDQDAHKLSFSVPREDEDESWREHVNRGGAGTANAVNEKPAAAGFGTLADLLKGVKVK